MRLLFAHDVVIRRDDKNNYYHESFNYSLWKRYLSVFDTITVASRVCDVTEDNELDATKLSSGENVFFVPLPSISSPIASITQRPKASKLLKEALREADVLISRLPSEIGLLAIQLAERMNKPWAVEVVGHAWDSLWYHGSWQGKIYAPIMTWRTKAAVRRAPYVFYVTKEFLQKHYPTYGKSIACSDVDIPSISAEVVKQRLTNLNNQQFPYKIGLIGSMSARYKGIDTALKALSLIKDKLPKFEFRILGGGNNKPWVDMARDLGIEEHVKFCGTLGSGEPVFNWLDELDLYIQPSLTEGLPRALIEAMSRGLPCLATRVGGIPELLPSSCLFDAKDFEMLSNLILKTFHDIEWRRELIQKNILKAAEYTKPNLERLRIEFLKEVISMVNQT